MAQFNSEQFQGDYFSVKHTNGAIDLYSTKEMEKALSENSVEISSIEGIKDVTFTNMWGDVLEVETLTHLLADLVDSDYFSNEKIKERGRIRTEKEVFKRLSLVNVIIGKMEKIKENIQMQVSYLEYLE